MNMSVKNMPVMKLLGRICVIAFIASSLPGCVDKDYDLGQDIDTSVNFGRMVEVPVGSFEHIPIADLVAERFRDYLIPCEGGYYVEESLPKQGLHFGSVNIGGLNDVRTGDYRVPGVAFKMNVKSTIPGTFRIEAEAIDAEGNPAENATVKTSGVLAAGTLESPVTTPLSIEIDLKDGIISFDGFRIGLYVESLPEEKTFISSTQGVQVLESYLVFPEGVTYLNR